MFTQLVVAMLIIVFIASMFLHGIISRQRKKPYPPGPKGLPIIGNMMEVDQLTHRGLAKLAQRHGGLFHMKMGLRHMFVISSPEEARQVLQVQDNLFSNRPATIAIRYLTYDRSDMVFAHYGPFWRQMRKLCVLRLFSRKRAESWQSVRDEVGHIVRAIASRAGSTVNIGELVFNFTRSIVYRAAFGSNSKERQDEFIAILQEFSKLFGMFNIADFIPFLTWVDPHGLKNRLIKARSALDRFIDQIIDDHVDKKKVINGHVKEEDNVEDMVDAMLDFYSEEGKVNEVEDLQSVFMLTKDNIKGIIMDVMFGTETIASGIEWAMTELMRNPKDLKRVQQELVDVIGLDQQVVESDLDKLPFFRCCIKETLRLHPPIPLLLHETVEDATLGGYHIPKQSQVTINIWAIGRDPNSWSDPEMFKPERFLNEGVPDFKGSNFQYIPFGSGRRSCPGMGLGLYALEMCMANLLHCFTWDLPNGMKSSEISVDDFFGLTAPKASRLMAVPRIRLLCPLN